MVEDAGDGGSAASAVMGEAAKKLGMAGTAGGKCGVVFAAGVAVAARLVGALGVKVLEAGEVTRREIGAGEAE